MGKFVQKYLVVARYQADITWLDKVEGWTPIVVQKKTDELEGDMPNEGREPAAFLHAILRHYDRIQPTDVWAFVQDNPFDHCRDLLNILNEPVRAFSWLGGDYLKTSDGEGKQDHPELPVAELYSKWINKDWPEGNTVDFAPGGQFKTTGKQLLSWPKEHYQTMYDDVCIDYQAWAAERLWGEIFTVGSRG